MLVLEGQGPQESSADGFPYPYDHPYFGQIFLAGLLKIASYTDFVKTSPLPSVDNIRHSIQLTYYIPRVLMGMLAVIDTFLIYKISEQRYNRKLAFIASVLFAVLPLTWMFRRISLDSILTPFLLSSVLLALYQCQNSLTIKIKMIKLLNQHHQNQSIVLIIQMIIIVERIVIIHLLVD